ncbi:helix-turn-helix domain-containing protein [Streptomyces sp. GS7]|uniref:helix-turn-helix domain-containing protein n=1 Tax=Streptomyces sp. GS7 TaxID=2692234 RepID=UPI001915F45C|nr:helix-turn-helix transcriptional regulator [Streptomyces sp. GS7]
MRYLLPQPSSAAAHFPPRAGCGRKTTRVRARPRLARRPRAYSRGCKQLGEYLFNRHVFAARRLTLGLSVEELANDLGVVASTVYRWESGETAPSTRTLVRISRSLHIPLLHLVKDDAASAA